MTQYLVNTLLPILLALLLASCAKSTPELSASSQTVSNPGPEVATVMNDSTQFEEVQVIQAAGYAAQSSGLITELAEKCWQGEIERPKVREACALAWAVGKAESPEFETKIREAALHPATRSRALALSLVRRPHGTSPLSLDELSQILLILGDDPLWVRGIALRDWLRANPGEAIVSSFRLLSLLQGNNKESRSADPATVAHLYFVSRKLGLAYADEIYSSYCQPTLQGLALGRCWRFLSALAAPDERGEEQRDLPELPMRIDSGWQLFERSFPERAIVLKPLL